MKHVMLDALPDEPVSHNPAIRKRVLVRPGELPHVTAFSRASFPPGEVASLHSHEDMYEVFYFLQGSGRMRVDAQEFSVSEGACIHVWPGEAHEIVNSGTTDMVVCYFGLEA